MLVETNQAESGQRGCSGRETDVLVMKPAVVGQGVALTRAGGLDGPARRRILAQWKLTR